RSSCSRITACGVPTTCPTLTTSSPGYLCWTSMSCSVISSGGPISQDQGGRVCCASALGIAQGLDLLGAETGYEPEGSEHLHVLLEEGGGLLDSLLNAVSDVEREPDAEITAQLGLPSCAGPRVAEGAADLLFGPAGRRAPADG